MRVALLATLLLLCGACQSGNSEMDPGAACLSCHGTNGPGTTFSVAGTLYPIALGSGAQGLAGATVVITDATGAKVTMTTSAVGNFYTATPLKFPIQAQVQSGATVFTMAESPPDGNCNSCHAITTSAGGANAPAPPGDLGYLSAPGHLYVFGWDGGCEVPQGECDGGTGPSFYSQVFPILQGQCLPCHSAVTQCAQVPDGGFCGVPPELDTYATVFAADFTKMIECQMPTPSFFVGSPEEIQTVFTWLQCGRLDN